ncbi:MAG: hypothetical protein QOG43_3383 [Actinomycetota bacterium]|nr:hypothetical protein [Actinomycetota bacterium]
MINLRYHVVSLVAVFLALGMGIVMGSTVIDRVTVDALNNNLNNVRSDINRTREENRKLSEQVREGQDFADQSLIHVVRDQLLTVPVLVIAVNGVDRKPVDALRQSLVTSGAALQGTVWVTSKMRLDNEGETRALAAALTSAVPTTTTTTPPAAGAPAAPAATPSTTIAATAGADELRQQALARLITEPASLAALVSAGFLAYEPPPSIDGGDPTSTTPSPGLGTVPVGGTRFVVVSGAGAEVGDDILASPLAQALATSGGRAVAAEAGQDTDGGRGVFVGLLRSDATVNGKVSTVDNLESPMGQAAVVLALEELGSARVGHFGVGPGAQRLLPALPA